MKFTILYFLSVAWIMAGCQSCEWVASPPYAHTPEDIWQIAYTVVASRYDVIKASEETHEIETEWRRQMSMQYLESYRYKAHVKIEPYQPQNDPRDTSKPLDLKPPDLRPRYVINVCVLREQNRDMDNPNIASQADWYPVGNDPEEANRLMGFIASKLALKRPLRPIKPTEPDEPDEDEEEPEYLPSENQTPMPDAWNWEMPNSAPQTPKSPN